MYLYNQKEDCLISINEQDKSFKRDIKNNKFPGTIGRCI